MRNIEEVKPGSFHPEKYWYPKAQNATLHPMVAFFLNMSTEQLVKRYCHLHPNVELELVRELVQYKPKFFTHSGTDLIHATTEKGNRRMVVIETNSSPSGQKSMPLLDDFQEEGGYRTYAMRTFQYHLKHKRKIDGVLAVLYDKNYMEASGYASAIADAFGEPCYLVPAFNEEEEKFYEIQNGVIYILGDQKLPVRACFRYVTQKPWNRIPIASKTVIFNPIVTCLAGGRNKLLASKAYEMFNAEYKNNNLKIFTPETIWDAQKTEIPLWVARMGGKAVVKVPYSNAGQGVYTIVNEKELKAFMDMEFNYDKFIVQGLIGNHRWSSEFTGEKYYHVGTMPNKNGESFALDIRMILHSTSEGFRPLTMYSRRAARPLTEELEAGEQSWDILGTNLSIKEGDNQWASDTDRLLLMDRKGFNRLGVGLDDLIDGFIQSVMATVAIDQMSRQLISSKGKFKRRLFMSLNNDPSLIEEILTDE